MRTFRHPFTADEEGSVLIIALLMLVFLTLIGVSATTTTEVEIQIAGNEQFHKRAFFNADSGVYAAPKLIRQCVAESAQPAVSAVTYLDAGSDTFYREVMGYDAHDATKDIRYMLSGLTVEVDVDRARQESLAGGGTEFGSGAEGVGVGSAGGVAVIYAMDSSGAGPAASEARVEAEYRLIPGVAGGL